jgi:peptide deformylase
MDMSILKVARMGHPVLRQVARKVEPAEIKSPTFQKLVDDMIETMREYDGIGLAAPQVHEGVRLAIIGIEEGRGDDRSIRVLPVVNPEVEPIGRTTSEDWEGCLSLPKLRGRVVRPDRVQVKALDRRGNKVEFDLSGYPARVAQHEIDHLDGVLFIDRMKSFETLCFMDEYSKYWTDD